jgi:hypothetical protein
LAEFCWTTAARRNIYRRIFRNFPVYDSFLLATLGEGLIFRVHRKTVLVCDAAASFVLGRKSALKALAQKLTDGRKDALYRIGYLFIVR